MKGKFLGLFTAATLMVAGSVFGTLAYLTDTDKVENTFTVGQVQITLDEADVTPDGAVIEDADRVQRNEYKLVPGHNYAKDPTVHFQADSEASYLFVEVENGLANIEETNTLAGINEQIEYNGWSLMSSSFNEEDNVVSSLYYKEVDANTTDTAEDYVVFEAFSINGEVFKY